MKISGGCHCGAVRFEAEVDPQAAALCHCTDCQLTSGAPYRWVVRASERTFRYLSGTPREYVKVSAAGNRRVMQFCEQCGSQLLGTSELDTGSSSPTSRMLSLRAGVVDQRAQLPPMVQVWCQSSMGWTQDLRAVPSQQQQ